MPAGPGERTYDRTLSRAIARAMRHNMLEQHSKLTLRGFDSIWQGNHRRLTPHKRVGRDAFSRPPQANF